MAMNDQQSSGLSARVRDALQRNSVLLRNAGSLAAFVEVTAGDPTGPGGGGGVTVADVPEPSTMLLAGLGLSFLGGAAWRKRRQTLAKAAA